MTDEIISAKLILSGVVQGIGFRWFVQKVAEEEDVQGYIRNNYNGSVEIVAETTKTKLEKFIQRIKTEHPYANISNIEISYHKVQGYKKFCIKY